VSLDWSHLRAISCDDVLAKLREVLPDATVQAQRNAIERGWEFSVEQGGVHYHVAICDADMEDGKIVAAKVLEVVGRVFDDSIRAANEPNAVFAVLKVGTVVS